MCLIETLAVLIHNRVHALQTMSLSAVEQAKKGIITLTREQRLQGGRVLPPIRTLSERAGVSRDSVWRALNLLRSEGLVESMDNGRYCVSQRWEEREARHKLRLAVFAEGASFIIKPLMSRYFKGLEAAAGRHGDEVRLYLRSAAQQEQSATVPPADYLLALGDTRIPEPFLQGVEPWRVIAVQTHPGAATDNILACDHFHGGELCASRVIESGYERPMLIYWAPRHRNLWPSFQLRILGFKKRWFESGRSPEALQMVQLDSDSLIHRFTELSEVVLGSTDRDCYFCFNDETAAFVTDLMADHGRYVPEQVGVIGFDGGSSALNHEPAVTTVVLPMEELGRRTPEYLRTALAAKRTSLGTYRILPHIFEGKTMR